MPTYEYKCTACNHAFERFESIMAAPLKRCPECGKAKVKRLMGIGAGLIFKGSGFYITDYRDTSYKDKAKAESGASAEASGGSDSKSDAKSDGKAESKTESKSEAKSESKSGASGESSKAAEAKSQATDA